MTPEQASQLNTTPGTPGYGQALLIGKKVRHKDGRVGEVERVYLGSGELFIWFGDTRQDQHVVEVHYAEDCTEI